MATMGFELTRSDEQTSASRLSLPNSSTSPSVPIISLRLTCSVKVKNGQTEKRQE